MIFRKNDRNPFAEGTVYEGRTPKKPLHLGRWIAVIAIAVFALSMAGDCFYTIGEQENAVVTTFGIPRAVTTSGLHFKLPIIQKVKKVDMTIHGLPIGYNAVYDEFIYDESLMITSDFNFVNVDFYLEYRVTDPIAYLYNSRQPSEVLKTLALSYIRDTVGVYTVDDVITTGKNQIQSEIKEKLGDRLVREDIGLQIVNVTVQDAEPPTDQVIAAFKEVENAKQGAETAINNANKYKSQQLPAAQAQADKLLQQAQAEKEARINEANGQVARFNSMYEEYSRFPLITRQRMYYETMEELLPGMKVIIDSGGSQTLKLLDLGETAAEEPAAAPSAEQ
ncbi:MAG: FtsH protease activity modulator HflK [Firmicutes bacterium]|nr:FtsH protease activity modulator HflK [Bacillota bacterium]